MKANLKPYCISCGKIATDDCVKSYHDIVGKKEEVEKP